MEDKFEFKIIGNQVVAVVTFKGNITKEACAELEVCRQKLSQEQAPLTVILFKNVNIVEASVYRELTLMQKEIRDKKKSSLFIVGLNPELKFSLLEKAIIRPLEVRKSLEDVLKQELAKLAA